MKKLLKVLLREQGFLDCLARPHDFYLPDSAEYFISRVSIFTKGGFKSEGVEGFSNLPKYIPFFYPKLFHPVHGIDKMTFQTFFAFTYLVHLQLVQINRFLGSLTIILYM